MRQRIDYLEHESSALADRLIRGQVDLAQQAENSITISHELHTLRDINSDAHKRLGMEIIFWFNHSRGYLFSEEAYETIRELSSKRDGDSLFTDTGTQVDDTSMIEHIHSLQEELMEAHSRKADLENTIRELKLRITELECANKRLKEAPPDDGIASIQEELIRVKMREAEASLSLKEMRQRLAELEQHWNKYSHQRPSISSQVNGMTGSPSTTSVDTATDGSSRANSPQHSPPLASAPQPPPPQQNGTTKGRFAKLTALMGAAVGGTSEDHDQPTIRELEDHLMGLRIREADAVAELKEMRQKVMELETQNHVCTNQLKRQDEELKRIRDEKELATVNEQKAATLLKEEQRKLLEIQGEMKEASVMQRLKYTDALQQIADLKENISQLEAKVRLYFRGGIQRGRKFEIIVVFILSPFFRLLIEMRRPNFGAVRSYPTWTMTRWSPIAQGLMAIPTPLHPKKCPNLSRMWQPKSPRISSSMVKWLPEHLPRKPSSMRLPPLPLSPLVAATDPLTEKWNAVLLFIFHIHTKCP